MSENTPQDNAPQEGSPDIGATRDLIQFTLPEGWNPGNAETAQAAGADFVAFCPGENDWFRPNLTVSGQLVQDDATLYELADRNVDVVRANNTRAALLARQDTGADDQPGLSQLLQITLGDDKAHVLRQVQSIVQVGTIDSQPVVYSFTLTGPQEVVPELAEGYQEFLRSVRPAEQG